MSLGLAGWSFWWCGQFVYGALLDTCRRAHRLDLALQYVRSMQTEDFKVNDVILINLMDSYGRAGGCPEPDPAVWRRGVACGDSSCSRGACGLEPLW